MRVAQSATSPLSVSTCTLSTQGGVRESIYSRCRLIKVSLAVYRVLYTFFWPAEFPGYHQWQQESQ